MPQTITKDAKALVAEANSQITTIPVDEAMGFVGSDTHVIVDLRDSDEFRTGHIAGSINIPAGQALDRIAELEKYKDKPLILTCDMGAKASHLGRQLRTKGFSDLYRIQGGLNAWRSASLPVVKE